jgi:3-methyladenine DNA glycosylase AlkD
VTTTDEDAPMTTPDADDVRAVLDWLERTGTRETREGMARYAIPSDTAFGVTVGELRKEARRLGRDHALALALWDTGRYEARMLAAFIDEPALVTVAQMDRWCDEFDSWATATPSASACSVASRMPGAGSSHGPAVTASSRSERRSR